MLFATNMVITKMDKVINRKEKNCSEKYHIKRRRVMILKNRIQRKIFK